MTGGTFPRRSARRARRALTLTVAALAASLFPTGVALAQQDTARVPALGAVVVTAERGAAVLASSAASVTRIAGADLARVPHATVADLLRLAPGFTVVSFDGIGQDPQLVVRGFYGAGEAEYVVLLLDGRPVSQLQSGVVPWSVLPPVGAIEAVEIVRGGSSALYGDAAIGAVINIISRRGGGGRPTRWELTSGSARSLGASIATTGAVARRDIAYYVAGDNSDGARDHSARRSVRAAARTELIASPRGALALRVSSSYRRSDDPGPLLDALMETDRLASDPLFANDRTSERAHAISIEWTRLDARYRASGSLDGDVRNTEAVRTLALAPGFGDTQERRLSARRAGGSVQLDVLDAPLPGRGVVTLGSDFSLGSLTSRWFAFDAGERGEISTDGEGSRGTLALFAQYGAQPVDAVRFTLGVRSDWIRDEYTARRPAASAGSESASHAAVSPRVGINWRYRPVATSAGHAYVTAGRSFKTATLDQLFDQRIVPVPFPPFGITTSNPALNPQYGTSVEAGAYQGVALGAQVRATASLSAYEVQMRDELDFDVATFRYINIGRSRHRGVEAGVTVAGSGSATAFANYAWQSVVARIGEHEGRQLKNVPRHTLSLGGTAYPVRSAAVTVIASSAHGSFVDDANTTKLDGYVRVDARLSWQLRRAQLYADLRNAFNAEYSTVAYLDQSGSGSIYHYPAAGRVLSVGLRGGW